MEREIEELDRQLARASGFFHWVFLYTLRERRRAEAEELARTLDALQRERNLIAADRADLLREKIRAEALATGVGERLAPVLTWLADEFGGDPAAFENNLRNGRIRLAMNRNRSVDNARVAAANEKLKQLLQAVDEDVQRHFIQPMFRCLRERLMKTGVGVGVLQRTSILSTNRSIARVDPKGSANLALGEEQDVLQGSLQLAQILAASQTGGLTALLGGLDRLPKEASPAVYGLATGNLFQVTPITDPTGQALRFRFDWVGQTQVREPNGVTDPQLPRIERHTINTEVQLSNLEIREVSRFQANAKLGLPRRTSGGIPILNNIPVLRDIPLIGWFTKREGRAAVVQQSLVLGQTSMFPTIGDVVDLLTLPPVFAEVPTSGDLNPEESR